MFLYVPLIVHFVTRREIKVEPSAEHAIAHDHVEIIVGKPQIIPRVLSRHDGNIQWS